MPSAGVQVLSEEAPAQAQAGLDGLKTFIDTLLLVTEAQAAAAPTSGADAPLTAPAPDAPAHAEQGAAAVGLAAAGAGGAVAAPPAHANSATTMAVDRSPAPVSALREEIVTVPALLACGCAGVARLGTCLLLLHATLTPAASACRRRRRPCLPAPRVCQ